MTTSAEINMAGAPTKSCVEIEAGDFHDFASFDAEASYRAAHGRPVPVRRAAAQVGFSSDPLTAAPQHVTPGNSSAAAGNIKSSSGTTKNPGGQGLQTSKNGDARCSSSSAGVVADQGLDTSSSDAELRIAPGPQGMISASTSSSGEEIEHSTGAKRRRVAETEEEAILRRVAEEFAALEADQDLAKLAAQLEPNKRTTDIKTHTRLIRHVFCFLLNLWRQRIEKKPDEEEEEDAGPAQESQLDSTTALNRKKLLETAKQLLRFSRHLQKFGEQGTGGEEPSKKMKQDVLPLLADLCKRAYERDYIGANQVYVDLTIGHTKWHHDMAHGEARHNKGYNPRRIKRTEGTEFMENEQMHEYILAFKRLLGLAENTLRP
ncbi:unnamed protein product [Amoebophrya sp. A120]|nr:unnamed protein product [Amoebophrya sp. A120]|eukprot:GSA120T00017412001.1